MHTQDCQGIRPSQTGFRTGQGLVINQRLDAMISKVSSNLILLCCNFIFIYFLGLYFLHLAWVYLLLLLAWLKTALFAFHYSLQDTTSTQQGSLIKMLKSLWEEQKNGLLTLHLLHGWRELGSLKKLKQQLAEGRGFAAWRLQNTLLQLLLQ